MISEDNLGNLTESQTALSLASADVAHGSEKVGNAIDELTSASLKRVLKAITFVTMAEDLLAGKATAPELSEEEQDLIDRIFALQEATMGFQQLVTELKDSNELDFSNVINPQENNDE